MEKLMRLPPGFRFHPTDEELVVQYLRRKVFSCPLPASIICEIDLAKYDPWDLPGGFDGEKYFFYQLDASYPKGNRSSRATNSGYWKATGKDRPVVASKRKELVGMKKVLVFHRGKPPHSSPTTWIMHEYRLANLEGIPSMSLNRKSSSHCSLDQGKNWMVCRVFVKKRATRMEDEEIPQHYNNLGFWNDRTNFIDAMRMDDDDSGSSSSSCVTDLSDEECNNKGEEASSKLVASSP